VRIRDLKEGNRRGVVRETNLPCGSRVTARGGAAELATGDAGR